MPVQHVPTLLVMKPISVTEIVSMATEVLIITDTPTARAAEEHAWLIHIYVSLHTHTRARAQGHGHTHLRKHATRRGTCNTCSTNKDEPLACSGCIVLEQCPVSV